MQLRQLGDDVAADAGCQLPVLHRLVADVAPHDGDGLVHGGVRCALCGHARMEWSGTAAMVTPPSLAFRRHAPLTNMAVLASLDSDLE